MKSLKENDIDEGQCCFIDEPNAGFLSFIYTCIKNHLSHPLLEKLKQQECNILIYDFGAGTCDISILRVDTRNNQFTSKNLAISKFFALGGNDIDRAIARHVLFPQLLKSSPSYEPTLIEAEEVLIPQLQATAEKLKISVTRWIASHNIESFQSLVDYLDTTFEDLTLENISVRKLKLTLVRPTLSIREFKAILDNFIGDFDGIHSPMHLLSPVIDALDKAQIERENVDAVLFIGGSCLNPLVRNCVMDYMNEYDACVESILPSDLRSHVSLGAAIHCFSYHGLGLDFIKPITSEAIFIITKNNYLEQIIPASSEVPTIKPFHTTLIVNQENQFLIELPICVGSKNKLLGVLNVESDDDQPFAIGSKVEVTASINHEKLLHIEAIVNDICAKTSILNPLANKELSKNEASMLKAKQKFNQALLDYEGRPPIAIAKDYANACLNAELYELAAELYIAIERMDKSQDFSTNICFAFERAGKHQKSNEWAEKAYKRQPNAVNAYNLSCKCYGEKKEEYLRLALLHNEYYTSALLALGRILDARGDTEGKELLERALIILQDQVFDNNIGSKECEDLIAVCDHLKGHDQLKRTAQELKKQIQHDKNELYSSEYLVESLKPALDIKRELKMGWWIGSDKLSTEQREIIAAIKNLTQVHWVQGAAGAGKTTVLAELAQELYVEYPNASFYYLTYTHALKELARKSFVEEGIEKIKTKFLTHTQFLKNNRACDFVFLDEVQDISTDDLLKIKQLAKTLIVAGDCNQTIYDNSPPEQEIINTLASTQYVLKLMYRLTASLAAIATKILPSSNIISAKSANTLANTEARLMQCSNQKDEFIWVVTEALARARADKPSCIIFSHHKDITAFYHIMAEHFNIEYSGSELYEKNSYEQNPYDNSPRLNYLIVNQNFKSHQVNLCYLGNGYGTLNEADKKPMVYIMTYHSAKGLDFENIFIPQLNTNKHIVYPVVLAKNPNLDKRLLYVAMTRSRCNLFLTYSTPFPCLLVQDLPNTKVIPYQPNQDNNEDEDFF